MDKRCPKCGATESSGVIIQSWGFDDGTFDYMCNSCAWRKYNEIILGIVKPQSEGGEKNTEKEFNRADVARVYIITEGLRMELLHCPYDDHDKEQTCKYYERGEVEKLGCYCKYMLDDQCACYQRLSINSE